MLDVLRVFLSLLRKHIMLIFVHELKLMIEYFFDLEDEVSTVMSHKFLELFHQINNIGKG